MGQGKRVSIELDPVMLKKEMGSDFSWIAQLEVVLQSPRYGTLERATMVRACTCMLSMIWNSLLTERLKTQKVSGLYTLGLARDDSYKTILEYLPAVNR